MISKKLKRIFGKVILTFGIMGLLYEAILSPFFNNIGCFGESITIVYVFIGYIAMILIGIKMMKTSPHTSNRNLKK